MRHDRIKESVDLRLDGVTFIRGQLVSAPLVDSHHYLVKIGKAMNLIGYGLGIGPYNPTQGIDRELERIAVLNEFTKNCAAE
jgi:hypothetical protein